MRDAVINFDGIKDQHYKIPSVDKAMPNKEGQKFVMPIPRAPKATANCAQIIDCVEGAADLVLHDLTVDDFHVTGDEFIDGNSSIGGDLNVDGSTTLVDLHVTNNLDVDGTATIDTLNVTNIIVGPGSDLSGMISGDINQCLMLGTDGKLYVACGGGGGFTCADVADCIDNSATVQLSLSNRFIDALTTDIALQSALDTYETNFIENSNFTLNGDWDFQGNITINNITILPQKKVATSWAAGAGDSSVTIVDTDSLTNSVILGWTVTSGTQLGFWQFDMSVAGQITITSTATETGTINFTYVLAV